MQSLLDSALSLCEQVPYSRAREELKLHYKYSVLTN